MSAVLLFEPGKITMHMQRLAVDMRTSKHWLKAKLAGKTYGGYRNGGPEMGGEGIDHENHDVLTLIWCQPCQSVGIGEGHIQISCLIVQ